jgi:LAS superfamily LD-carboxypeptidase LdcB
MKDETTHFSLLRVLNALAITIPLTALGFGAIYTKEEFAARTLNAQKLRASIEAENNLLLEKLANASLDIAQLQAALDMATSSIESLEKTKRRAEREIRELEETLETDKQLLQKYSKVFFLNEHYEPSDLEDIDPEYLFNPDRPAQFHGEAMRDLERMLDDAQEDGYSIKVVSAFRSFETQSQLKSNYSVRYGTGANAFSADQGYSEHQLGTAVDLTSPTVGGLYTSFGTSPEFKWLKDNAHRFGFILSYPEGNQYYVYEPWHWRFVGSDLARELEKKDMNFYDMEQRDIDKYLGDIFD